MLCNTTFDAADVHFDKLFLFSDATAIKFEIPNSSCLFVCLFVLSGTSNFSAIWRLSPLPATGLQI
jgi:hypothetical protein